MSDDNPEPPLLETIPTRAGDVSAIASAHAPVVYLDGAPVSGFYDGVVNVTLDYVRRLPTKGGYGADRVVVAHLRMSLEAARNLRSALDAAISMSVVPEGVTPS